MVPTGMARKLLDELKYRHGFPPRAAAMEIKSELAVRGISNSTALAQKVASIYLRVVQRILDDFADQVLRASSAFGVTTSADVQALVAAAHQEVFNLARGLVRDETMASNYADLAMSIVDEQRGPILDHLGRKIELYALGEGSPKPSIELEPKELEQKFGIVLSIRQAVSDFEEWVKIATELGNTIGFLFLDLDNFKALNTRFTNSQVDRTILIEAQRLLVKLVKGRGEVYRHGGDEFLLVLPNLDDEEARALAEKVRRAFEAHKFEVGNEVVNVTVSVGVAVWPLHGSNYETVLEAANRAQVEAKGTRNTSTMAGR